MGTAELSPWARVPVASQEGAGWWRGQSLQVCGLRSDQGAVRTVVRMQAQREGPFLPGLRSQGRHCVTGQVTWRGRCAGTWRGTTWHRMWHGVGPCEGPWTPVRPCPRCAPLPPPPGKAAPWLPPLWTSSRQVTPGQLAGGGRALLGPAVQAPGPSLGQADRGGLREASPAATPLCSPLAAALRGWTARPPLPAGATGARCLPGRCWRSRFPGRCQRRHKSPEQLGTPPPGRALAGGDKGSWRSPCPLNELPWSPRPPPRQSLLLSAVG